MHHQPPMTPMPPVLLHGQATAWSVQALAAARAQPVGESFVVDASGLTQFDSSALAALLELRRGLQARQQGLRLVGAPGRLLELAALYGVTELLGT
jgi:phospholipid transport system transporter-binding protein